MKTILYTINCPRCKVLEKKLDQANIEFEKCEDLEVMKSKNFKTAPMLEVGDNIMDFTEAVKYINNIK